MADNKPYYYIRLKEDFFNSPEIKAIESLRGGYKYSNILLKMYLLSLRDEGRLTFRKDIPYDVFMLSKMTGFSKIEIENALKIFRKFKLIEVLDTGTIYMMDIQEYIGNSSTEADRKRKYRKRIDSERSGHLSGHLSDIHPPETELELEIELETETDKSSCPSGCGIPSLTEVKEYCKGKQVDPEKFYKYNQERNWTIGGKPIRDWMKIADWWDKNERKTRHTPSYGDLQQYETIRQPWEDEIVEQAAPKNLPSVKDDYMENCYANLERE